MEPKDEAKQVVLVTPTPPATVTGEISELEAWATDLVITTPEELTTAVERVKSIKSWKQGIVDFFASAKKKAHEAHREIVAKEKSLTDVADRVEGKAKAAIVKYNRQEEERREAERWRLQAEADERARKERERLEKEAAKLKTPELREERMAAAAEIVAPEIQVAAPEAPAGVATRKLWRAEVTDASLVPREWLIPDQAALDGFAKATKGAKEIPGVRFYAEDSLAIGRR